ncbi:hypothetical protein L3X38_044835 [Prunus dulcis]|uniref:DUF4219 domain-containing protein n=1 Tax=Prunus dulcis TaxID=3755 RepID=A0AAD4UZF4_PRUDU|nr:hypothetical protein L3X38_044835 [Prunus dulcis]
MASEPGSGAAELRTPVFNGENYEFWSIRMKTILKLHGLWDLVENGLDDSGMKKEKEEATETEKSMVAQILMKDARALGLIQSAFSDQLFPRIVNEETSKGAWDILKLEFRGDKHVRNVKLQGLRREFEYARMKDSESLSIYLVRLFNMMNQMKSYGEELSRERIMQKLLFSLPKSCDSICSVIEHSKDLEILEVQEVVASLKSFELRLDRHTENFSESAFASLNVEDKKSKNESFSGNQSFQKSTSGTQDFQNHWKPNDVCIDECPVGNLLYKARVLHQFVVSKLVQPKRVSCEGEETADTNELEKVDAALNDLITHKSKKSDYAMQVEGVKIQSQEFRAI